MKLSVNDLNVFVDVPKDIAKLCEDLSRLGLEVESCIPYIAPKNVVVGKVLEKAPHKNAEKLSVCQVDVGKEVLQIVCGAKKCRKKPICVSRPQRSDHRLNHNR